ncbi:MAG: hypothetical protein IID36_07590, partial [Planctomycetes bacterium]|nr:hypothetical protein [Planctomycetota bacterium]
MPRDHHLGSPHAGRDPEQLELEREQAGIAPGTGDVRVDALDVRADDLDTVVVVVVQLLRQISSALEEAGSDVT